MYDQSEGDTVECWSIHAVLMQTMLLPRLRFRFTGLHSLVETQARESLIRPKIATESRVSSGRTHRACSGVHAHCSAAACSSQNAKRTSFDSFGTRRQLSRSSFPFGPRLSPGPPLLTSTPLRTLSPRSSHAGTELANNHGQEHGRKYVPACLACVGERSISFILLTENHRHTLHDRACSYRLVLWVSSELVQCKRDSVFHFVLLFVLVTLHFHDAPPPLHPISPMCCFYRNRNQ